MKCEKINPIITVSLSLITYLIQGNIAKLSGVAYLFINGLMPIPKTVSRYYKYI